MFNLSDYMSLSINELISRAMKIAKSSTKEAIFLSSYFLSSKRAETLRTTYEENGTHIPPFLIASITTSCNLFCSGCYARANETCNEHNSKLQLSVERWEEIFDEAGKLGISFILLAGGEPLMNKEVIKKAAAFKNIIFPIFTNGTLIDEFYVNMFSKNRNLVPFLSIEGNEETTDTRRGNGTYKALINAMNLLKSRHILFGTSITVTKENLNSVTDLDYIRQLKDNGCCIVIYVEYVPVNPEASELAPDENDRIRLEKQQIILNNQFSDMIFLSFPGDEKYTKGCLAAGRGFFHISANGSAEPCPFSPFSDMNLKDYTILEVLSSPLFNNLKESGLLIEEHDGGCLLFQKEQEVKKILSENSTRKKR